MLLIVQGARMYDPIRQSFRATESENTPEQGLRFRGMFAKVFSKPLKTREKHNLARIARTLVPRAQKFQNCKALLVDQRCDPRKSTGSHDEDVSLPFVALSCLVFRKSTEILSRV